MCVANPKHVLTYSKQPPAHQDDYNNSPMVERLCTPVKLQISCTSVWSDRKCVVPDGQPGHMVRQQSAEGIGINPDQRARVNMDVAVKKL